MKILHLTLKKKWFDMIVSGEKKEEYREKKTYWCRRLVDGFSESEKNGKCYSNLPAKKYDTVKFTNGYSKNAPSFIIECLGIEIGKAKPEWSDNWQGDVFIIKLGEIISINRGN